MNRLLELAQCRNIWDRRRDRNGYRWDGGSPSSESGHFAGDPNTPTDAEILLELFFSRYAKEAVDGGSDKVCVDGRHLMQLHMDYQRGLVEPKLRKRGTFGTGHVAILQQRTQHGMHLFLVAPNHAPQSSLPLWHLPSGHTNLFSALALFAYYVRYLDQGNQSVDPFVTANGTVSQNRVDTKRILAIEACGETTWELLCKKIFYCGQRDASAFLTVLPTSFFW